jgi:hypothetical protein
VFFVACQYNDSNSELLQRAVVTFLVMQAPFSRQNIRCKTSCRIRDDLYGDMMECIRMKLQIRSLFARRRIRFVLLSPIFIFSLANCKRLTSSFSLSGDEKKNSKEYFTHSTSQFMSKSNPGSLSEASSANATWLREVSNSAEASDAEKLSALHQLDLLRVLNSDAGKKLKELGLNPVVFTLGVVDSDKGKLSSYQSLFKDPSEKSDFMISTMLGQTSPELQNVEVVSAISEVLAESFGFPTNTYFLNPSLKVLQIQKLFSAAPILVSWMHEWPGITDSAELYLRKVISRDEFKEVLMVSLFHNGPQEGFWKKMTEDFVPTRLAKEAEPQPAKETELQFAKELYYQTVYTAPSRFGKRRDTGGALSYPTPVGFTALVHVIFDRLSQGTRGGLLKIFKELGDGRPLEEKVLELLTQTSSLTLKQLGFLKDHIVEIAIPPESAGLPTISKLQSKALLCLVEASEKRISDLIKSIETSLINEPSLGLLGRVGIKETFHFRGRDQKAAYDALEDWLEWEEQGLVSENGKQNPKSREAFEFVFERFVNECKFSN